MDNDGFPDLYIANGHETRQTVREYEPEFWLHDIYVGNSQENHLAHAYFRQKFARTRARGWSYGGYERNRLFLNVGGTNFTEVAHLLGVAMPKPIHARARPSAFTETTFHRSAAPPRWRLPIQPGLAAPLDSPRTERPPRSLLWLVRDTEPNCRRSSSSV